MKLEVEEIECECLWTLKRKIKEFAEGLEERIININIISEVFGGKQYWTGLIWYVALPQEKEIS